MKYKKYSYILVLILMLMIGINKTYAVETMTNTKTELKYSENNNDSKTVLTPIANKTEHPDCVIFGDKNNPDSIRYLVNEILQYPKIIVPILVILLGTLDLAKAVIASKEDEMRKAQTTFIKRVLVGVVIFFVPMILDIIMYFMDLVLGYTGCGL